MSYKVMNAYPRYEDGKVVATEITIKQDEPTYRYIVTIIDGDHTKRESSELVDLALEKFFEETFVERAMGEAVEKVATMDARIKYVDSKIEEVRELANSVQENADMVSGAILELMDTLTMKGLLDDEFIEEA